MNAVPVEGLWVGMPVWLFVPLVLGAAWGLSALLGDAIRLVLALRAYLASRREWSGLVQRAIADEGTAAHVLDFRQWWRMNKPRPEYEAGYTDGYADAVHGLGLDRGDF